MDTAISFRPHCDLDRCCTALAAALGRSHVDSDTVVSVEVESFAHRVENMSTESLDLVTATLTDGTRCQMFRKQLHHISKSSAWESIPEEFRAATEAQLDWLDELRVYRSALDGDLPAGLRLPQRWLVDEPVENGDAVREIWMEVVADHAEWSLDRYARVAGRLGAMAGRWPEERVTERLGFSRRPIGHLFFGKIVNFDLIVLSADDFWQQQRIDALPDRSLRRDLFELAERMPAMIADLDGVPHGLAHGDATPDNLLEPPDGTTVAIDWSYGHSGAVGSDLGQLLIGRIERGGHHPDELGPIWATVRSAFLSGLRAEGSGVAEADVDLAFKVHVAARSVFSAVNVDHRPDLSGDELDELVSRRAAMARFCLDLILD
jgi:hypothetical protein